MQAIQTWLNSARNYIEGTILYTTYGTNAFLKKRFESGPDEYNKQKLAEELQKLAGDPEPKKKIVSESPNLPQTNPEENQAKYDALLQKRDNVLRQIERNMALLDFSNNKNVLHETAKQILRLHQQKTEIWAQIDFFKENGCFETPPEEKIKTKEQEIQLLYQAISKAKTRLKDPSYNQKTKTEALITKHLKRLTELKLQP